MKTVCAWCGEILSYKCPYCGEPLRIVTHPETGIGKALLCDSGLSQIYFTDTSHFSTTHTICSICAEHLRHGLGPSEPIRLTPEDRANLYCIDKKRGPTGAVERHNTPNSDAAKKDGIGQ